MSRKDRKEIVTEGETSVETPLPPAETKAERFKRLANKRVSKAIKILRNIGNLSTKGNYEYTPEQADRIFGALAKEVNAIKDKFAGTKAAAESFSV